MRRHRDVQPARHGQFFAARDGALALDRAGTIVSLLATHALIDEYRLLINPVLLAEGRRLIDPPPRIAGLDLTSVMCHPPGYVTLHGSGHQH